MHRKQRTRISLNQSTPSNDDLLTASEFAEGMPFSKGTLENSRYTGILMGVSAPKFYRFGRLIRYPLAERQAWLERFNLAATSAEHYHINRKK